MTAANQKNMDATQKPTALEIASQVGLHFNINNIKRASMRYFNDHDMVVHDSDGAVTSLRISGSHVTIAAAMQAMCGLIINNTAKYIQTDKYDFKNISYSSVLFSLKEDPSLHAYYMSYLPRFDENMSYDECPFTDKEINAYVEQINRDYQFDTTARRLVKFLLTTFFYHILSTCYQFILFAKKKTVPITITTNVVKAVTSGETQRSILDFVQPITKAWIAMHAKEGDDDEEATATAPETADDEADDVADDEEEAEPVVEIKEVPKKLKKGVKKEEPVADIEDEPVADLPKKSGKAIAAPTATKVEAVAKAKPVAGTATAKAGKVKK